MSWLTVLELKQAALSLSPSLPLDRRATQDAGHRSGERRGGKRKKDGWKCHALVPRCGKDPTGISMLVDAFYVVRDVQSIGRGTRVQDG